MFKMLRSVIARRGSVGADQALMGARRSSVNFPSSTSRPIIVDVKDFDTENDGRTVSAVTASAYFS
jgi:hypothetical protein